MVIEWLKFRMAPENRERYVELDSEIWTAALSQYPGFVSKEVWIDPHEAGELILVIRWATREQWKAIPEADLARVTERFDAAFGLPYEMVESTEFQVRRFPVTS
ncbi:MAG: TIGR03792 family protein [Cyanobacteria bacterium Co-bin13]|nr:TIGR03792 family protein [Cyanobacteria bacterium Co-bin13]